MSDKILLAYFGHHKCASRWIISIIELICRDLNLNFTDIDDPPGVFDQDINSFVKKKHIDFLAYSNSDIKHVKNLGDFLGFHVVRDPRDIVVSAYFSHLYSHSTNGWPALADHREKLQKVSKEEGLFLEMEFSRKELEDIYNWDYNQPNILEIRMEDLITSPYETMIGALYHLKIVEDSRSFKQIFLYSLSCAMNRLCNTATPIRFSNNKIPIDTLLGYIYQNRFSKKADGRKRGEEDTKSHYRKGVAGDWSNHFSEEHRKYFIKNFSDLLIKLGYETTSAW